MRILLTMVLSAPLLAYAQPATSDSLAALNAPHSILAYLASDDIDWPTLLEKTQQMGEGVVPILQQSATPSTGSTDGSPSEERTALRSVQLLESLGTPLAFAALGGVVTEGHNIEARGVALNAMAARYYDVAASDTTPPERNVVGLMVQFLGNETTVAALGKTFDEIAREGLKNWMGWNWAAGTDYTKALRLGKGRKSTTLAEFKAEWWEENGPRLVWDYEKSRFVITKTQ